MHEFSRRQFLQCVGASAAALMLPTTLVRNKPRLLSLGNQRSGQIIADHTIIEDYQHIPQFYIDEVKKMWAIVPGESHSAAYRDGLILLEAQDARFRVNIRSSGIPEAYTDAYLRFSRATWGDVTNATGWRYGYGEEDWYTSATAIARTKAHLDYCFNTGPQLAAMGFGWCWDTTWTNPPGGGVDPVYNVRWAGSSNGGPEGNLRWGLDAEDQALTGNSVCMDTYLNATQQYIDHCALNGYPTKVFFTTSPVDGYTGENGYQRELKHTHIRNYVLANTSRILFDYADILCWNDAGVMATASWNGNVYPNIHPDNDGEDTGHIGNAGALRLAKAMWWMLARIAGWDGMKYQVYLPEITR